MSEAYAMKKGGDKKEKLMKAHFFSKRSLGRVAAGKFTLALVPCQRKTSVFQTPASGNNTVQISNFVCTQGNLQ